MSISAIVPVWNGRADLERLIASLAAQTRPAAELLVVDNGSTDGAPELAREKGARVISMGRNSGFAPAVNRGIREASGEWIAVLNSDVQVASDYFARLSAAGSWFATGKILSLDNPEFIDGTFDLVCRGGTAWRAGNGCRDGPVFSSPRAIFSPPWTAALFRAELFARAGVLDERFESYLEDVDFGLRCAALGLSGSYVPEALAWHRGSTSLGRWHSKTVRLIARNQILLLARHYPRRLLWSALWPIVVAELLWGAVAARHGRAFAWLSGKAQGLQLFSECRANRYQSSAELFKHLREDEAAIREIQHATGSDLYWKLYFLLTAPESK
jgi:GT2 family glycosyltransferase